MLDMQEQDYTNLKRQGDIFLCQVRDLSRIESFFYQILYIENILYERGIDFEYERMIEDNGRRCIPDFTFEDASGDTILWEHLGMLDNPAYKESWEKKRDFYKSIGYIEGVNLFTTVDHENGSIDSTEIAAIVDKLEDLI